VTPGRPGWRDLLRPVSRSFYLSLRVLPAALREPVSLAYLLARTTDTIADAGSSLDRREILARVLRAIGGGPDEVSPDLARLVPRQDAESRLLASFPVLLRELERQETPDRGRIRQVLATIGSGQDLDLARFGGAASGSPGCLETEADLEDYTYRVAGCVGEFWTHLSVDHGLVPVRSRESLLEAGVALGKGLQLVNILRDLPADLRAGRCYLPRQVLEAAGVAPEGLLEDGGGAAGLGIFRRYLLHAGRLLGEGARYPELLPYRPFSLRLAPTWPLRLGFRTLELLNASGVPAGRKAVKVRRGEVRRLLLLSILLVPLPALYRKLFRIPAFLADPGKAEASASR